MSQSLLSTQCPPIMPNVSGSRVWNQTFVPRKGLAIALSTWMIFACLHMKAYVCFMKSVRVDYLSRTHPQPCVCQRPWTTHWLSETLDIALFVYIWNRVFVSWRVTSKLPLSKPAHNLMFAKALNHTSTIEDTRYCFTCLYMKPRVCSRRAYE